MPGGNIETYTNRVEAPRADSAGSEAYEILGRHVEASYAQAGNAIGSAIGVVGKDAEQYEEIQDSNAISVAGAKAFSDLSQNLRTTMANADPNQADQTAEQWRDGVMEKALSGIGADVNTQHGRDMAERVQNTLREEFTRQSIGASATLAGQAAVDTVTQTTNGLAQAVSNDPSLLPTAMAYMHGTINDQITAHGSLGADEVARIRSMATEGAKNIGVAAFQTMAQRNPDAAKAALERGDFAGMFNGDEIGTLNRYADAQGKAKIEADKAAATELKAQQKQQFDAAGSAAYASMLQPDGTLVVPKDLPQQIVQMALMPGAEPGTVRSMIDMVKTVNDQKAKGTKVVSDPHTYESFSQQMLNGTLTDRDIYNARANSQLSDKDVNYFRSGIRDLAADPAKKDAEKQFQAFLTSQKSAFTAHNIFGGTDPKGAQNFFQFSQAARAQFDQAYKDGTWQQALQANNPNYIGKIAPAYMTNKKGATPSTAPHFANDADADAGVAKLQSGMPFYGPDGQLHYKK